MARQHSKDAYDLMKTGTRRLIKACGGLESAEQGTRINRTQLSNCQKKDSDQFLPIDALIDLCEYGEDTSLVRDIVRLLKNVGSDTTADDAALNNAVISAHKEAGEAVQVSMEAFLDGELSDEELRNIEKEADEAAQSLINVRDMARRRLAEREI